MKRCKRLNILRNRVCRGIPWLYERPQHAGAFLLGHIDGIFIPQSSLANPVDSTEAIVESGDPGPDGPVQGVVEMVEKLAGVKEPSESLSDMSSAFGSVEMKRLMTLQFRRKRAGGTKKVVAA